MIIQKADRSCITIKYDLFSGKRLNRSKNEFLFVAIDERLNVKGLMRCIFLLYLSPTNDVHID